MSGLSSTERIHTESSDTIKFTLFYFKEMKMFNNILRDSEEDLKSSIGETKIIIAT